MLAVRAGDVDRLGELFQRYHAPLFDFLSRVTGDRTSAEDLVQDVFVRILKYRSTFRDDSAFETWLYRLARNARADYFKRRRPALAVDARSLEIPAPGAGAQQVLERRDETTRLRRAFATLPDDKRELLALAKIQGMKYERIAQLLTVGVGTVKVRVHRAVAELRETMRQQSAMDREEQPCGAKTSGTSLQAV